jgi:surface polysaccharide O-acyltransferase-like enzyme
MSEETRRGSVERDVLQREGAQRDAAPSGRIQYLDLIRVLSMLAVVLLHTVAGTLRSYYGSSQWHFSNVLSAFATASVPLFFMISGALLLSSPHTASVGYTLRRRVTRVLVPFLVWSLIAVAYYLFVSWRYGGAADWTAAIDKLKHLPGQPVAIHLWFMYALIPLYILSPFIKKMVDSLDRNLVIYLLAIWVFFSAILPLVAAFLPESYRPILLLDPRYNLSVMAGYAGYFVAGYYLMQWRRPVSKPLLSLIVIVDVVCITLGTWWKTTALGEYAEVFKTYSGLFVVVLSCALFLLCKELLRERRLRGSSATVVTFLAPLAFGVYLVHNLLVDFVGRQVPWWPATSIWMVVVSYLTVLAASIAVVLVLTRIKPLSWAFTGQVYRGWWRRKSPTGETMPVPARVPGTTPMERATSEQATSEQATSEQATSEQATMPLAPPDETAAAGAVPSSARVTPAPPPTASPKPGSRVPQPAEQTTVELPKVWRPETPRVKPPRSAEDTAERPRGDRDWEI